MKSLSLDQLHELRIAIFTNAISLQKEAQLLFKHEFYARAYLLAHLAVEEVGKLTIVLTVVSRVRKGEKVDWQAVTKRFRGHQEKITADDAHHSIFALPPDTPSAERIAWLKRADKTARSRVVQKNSATYVDASGSMIFSPLDVVTHEAAEEMLRRSAASLEAHWQSETTLNPVLRAALLAKPEEHGK